MHPFLSVLVVFWWSYNVFRVVVALLFSLLARLVIGCQVRALAWKKVWSRDFRFFDCLCFESVFRDAGDKNQHNDVGECFILTLKLCLWVRLKPLSAVCCVFFIFTRWSSMRVFSRNIHFRFGSWSPSQWFLVPFPSRCLNCWFLERGPLIISNLFYSFIFITGCLWIIVDGFYECRAMNMGSIWSGFI